jgi:hypothetical protein
MRLVRLLLFAGLAALAISSVIFVRGHVGDAGTLIADQQHTQPLSFAAVDRVVRLAPTGLTHRPGRSASCKPQSDSALHNPWTCIIDYGGGSVTQYTVQIASNGSFTGSDQILLGRGRRAPVAGVINGCCIPIP